jgi:hypothetical protein
MDDITDRLDLSPWIRRVKSIPALVKPVSHTYMYIYSVFYIYTHIIYVDALHRWTDSDACAWMPQFGGVLRQSSAQQPAGQEGQSRVHIYDNIFRVLVT